MLYILIPSFITYGCNIFKNTKAQCRDKYHILTIRCFDVKNITSFFMSDLYSKSCVIKGFDTVIKV